MSTSLPRPPAPVRGRAKRSSALALGAQQLNAFPYRQTVRIPLGVVAETRARVQDAFRATGFQVATTGVRVRPIPGRGRTEGGGIVAEGELRRAPMSLKKRSGSFIILSCGVALGALEALLFANPLYALPWIGLTGLAALILWLAFGRAWESVVVVALVEVDPGVPRPPGASADSPIPHQVTWLAAQVRSEVFPGSATRGRDAVGVVADFRALNGLKAAISAFGRLSEPFPPSK